MSSGMVDLHWVLSHFPAASLLGVTFSMNSKLSTKTHVSIRFYQIFRNNIFNVDFGPLEPVIGAGTEVAPIGATRGEGGDHLRAMRAMAAMTRSEPWAMADMDRSEIVK